ncbi:MAG: 30S ribosomal protein S4 [bacterium]
MGRYIGPKCKLCRREGIKLYLKGEKCYSDKCPLEKRNYPPGQHGFIKRRPKLTTFGIRLREKQKVKRIYGVSEKMFRKYFEEAKRLARLGKGFTGQNLMKIIERRIDNVIYRAGFAASRAQARQIISHGFVFVNEKNVDVPSYLIKMGDVIKFKPKVLNVIKQYLEGTKNIFIPSWINADHSNLTIKILREPERSDIEYPIEDNLIVEFYSR